MKASCLLLVALWLCGDTVQPREHAAPAMRLAREHHLRPRPRPFVAVPVLQGARAVVVVR